MRKLVKIVFIIGLLFWASFLAYGVAKMYAYNGFGNHYSFVCRNANSLEIEEENSNLKITYSYSVEGEDYTVVERIASELFYQNVSKGSDLVICFNETYPSLSYIKEVNLSVSREKVGIIVSLIFIAIILVLYLFAKRDYWIQKYKVFFEKL